MTDVASAGPQMPDTTTSSAPASSPSSAPGTRVADIRKTTLIISCGALAREVSAAIRLNGWHEFDLICLPAIWHNHPERIAPGVEARIRAARGRYRRIFCLYADCGTGGALDAVLAREGVERLPGAHCYAAYAGLAAFERMTEAEPGCFYLTDYLVRHFDRLIVAGLGLDRFPQLHAEYFRNYTTLVHLAQIDDPVLDNVARDAAARLGLAHRRVVTGLGEVGQLLRKASGREAAAWAS